jgi:hypothetical protein
MHGEAEKIFFDKPVLNFSPAGVTAYCVIKLAGPVLVLHPCDDLVQTHLKQIKAASHNASFLDHDPTKNKRKGTRRSVAMPFP